MPAGKPAPPAPLSCSRTADPTRGLPGVQLLAQFLASRGYAVLQPQFRARQDSEMPFRRRIPAVGGLMQDDVTDGVHAMIEQAWRTRTASVSSEPPMAACGAGRCRFTPRLYACAASINGVRICSLLREKVPMYGTGRYGGTYCRLLLPSGGHASASRPIGSGNRSPINAVTSITIRYHRLWTGDAVVPNEQSERMAPCAECGRQERRVATLSVKTLAVPNDTRVQVLKELDSFLKSHL